MSKAGRGTAAATLLLAVCGEAHAQFFRAARPFSLGGPPGGVRASCVAAADLNGDGNLDLAVGDDGQNALVILLGDGAGSFGPPFRLAAPLAPSAVAVADFNGDGRMDLAVAGFGSASVSLMLGDGAGGFVESVSATVGAYPSGLAVADFDQDGKLDVAASSYLAGNVTLLRGDGAGGVMGTSSHDAGIGPTSIAAADFNGDSWPDLAVTDSATAKLAVLLGDGAGGFQPWVGYGVGLYPLAVAAGDVDGNGTIDLAVANQVSDSVSILVGDGSGGFTAGGSLAAGTLPNALVSADLNGDGRLDLGVLASNAVGLLFGDGAGGFSPLRRFGAGSEARALVPGDFDGDGRMDLLTANDGAEVNGNVTLLRGEGGGSFEAAGVFAAGFRPRAVAAADLSGDGKVDLAVAGFFGVTVLLGDGAGGFGSLGTFQAGSGPAALAVGDVSQDGIPDLAVANESSGTVSILVGTGGGAFGPPVNLPVDLAPRAVALADLDADGRSDLAVASSSGVVSILLATGPASFAAPVLYAAGVAPQALVVGRLNDDVRPDLVVANHGSDDASVLLGSGGGAFLGAVGHPVGPSPTAVALEDFDGDSKLDAAVAVGGAVRILRGDGAGGLTPAESPSVGLLPVALVAADLSADARMDLALAKDLGEGLAVLAGDGSGGFMPRRYFAAGFHPSGLAVADVDADGRADLAVVSHDDDSAWIYLGAPVVGGADLSVGISDSADPVFSNDVFTYTVTVSNAGPMPATAVQVRNRVPASVQFLSSVPGAPACVYQGTDVLCQLGTIAAGASRTVTLAVKAGLNSQTLVDEAELTAHSPDPDPLNDFDSETTSLNPADLAVSIADSDDPVAPGIPFTYDVTITNQGPAAAADFALFDTLPPLLTLVSTQPPPPTCTSSAGTIECSLGPLPSGGSTSVAINVVAPTGFTEVTNAVSVTLFGLDTDHSNDAADETTRGALGYGRELVHGARMLRSLGGAATPGEERFLVAEAAAASYEVVVDATSGDLAPPSGALSLQRLGADTASVLQTAVPVGTGHSRSLRWESASAAEEVIRVSSTGCSVDCGPEDVYRIRAYETTLAGSRFNTTGSQTTVLVLRNAGQDDASASVWLWNASGSLAQSRVLSLPAGTTRTLDLATVAPGIAGSLTVSHTAPYGALLGKTVALEPATGFTFDTTLVSRPR